jgi:hypothetical protein
MASTDPKIAPRLAPKGFSDLDLDEDDKEFQRIMAARKQELMSAASKGSGKPTSSVAARRPVAIAEQPLSHTVLQEVVQTFERTDRGACVANYVARGSEINAALRRAADGKGEDSKHGYAKDVDCLDKLAKPLNQLIRTTGQYVVLYRTASYQYESKKNAGFMSTASRILPGFGSEKMRIYVPVTIPVLVADITRQVSTPSAGTVTPVTYEIILPRNTVLHGVATVGENEIYYRVSSGDRDLDEVLTRQILADAARSSARE